MKGDLVSREELGIMKKNREKILKELVEVDAEIKHNLIWKADEASTNNEALNWDLYTGDWSKLNQKLAEISKEMGERLSGIHPGERDKFILPRQEMLNDFLKRFAKDSHEDGGFVPRGINALGAVKLIKDREKESGKKDK